MDEKKVLNEIQQEQEPDRTGKLCRIFSKSRFRALMMCMALACMLSLSAFAEGAEVTVAGVLSEATPVLTTATGSVWTLMTGNPVCKFALGCAILAVGFRFLRKCLRISHKA